MHMPRALMNSIVCDYETKSACNRSDRRIRMMLCRLTLRVHSAVIYMCVTDSLGHYVIVTGMHLIVHTSAIDIVGPDVHSALDIDSCDIDH